MAGGIFEAFYLLFESNADDIKEGAEKAEKTTDQLESKLKKTDAAAAKAGGSFADMAAKAAQALLPLVGLAAVSSAVEAFTETAVAAGDLSRAVKMDVEQLTAWQGAIERSGGSADAFNGSVKSLADNLYAMKRGGGGEAATAMWQLGVKARDARGQIKDANTVLLDLSDRFSRMNSQSAINFGAKMGLDEKTVLLLQKGRKGVEELLAKQKELATITQADVDNSKKYKEAQSDLGKSLSGVSGIIARALAPAITGAMQGATDFFSAISKHKGLVEGFFMGLALLLGLIAIKSAIAFAPFLLFAAVILGLGAAFAMLYDDVQAFLGGHNSMIGELSKDYPWIGEMVLQIVDALKLLGEIAKAVGTFLVESISSPAQALDNLKAKIGPLLDAFQAKFPRLGQAIRDVGTIISGLATLAGKVFGAIFEFVSRFSGEIMAVIDAVLGGISGAIGWVAGLFGDDEGAAPKAAPAFAGLSANAAAPDFAPGDPVYDSMARGRAGLASASSAPLSAVPPGFGSAMQPTEINKDIRVDVRGPTTINTQATDAAGIAGAYGASLQGQLAGALEHVDDGVAG